MKVAKVREVKVLIFLTSIVIADNVFGILFVFIDSFVLHIVGTCIGFY